MMNITEETTLASYKPTLLNRLLNVHTVKAIGAALASFGVMSSEQLQTVIDGSGGDMKLIVTGVIGYVVANIWRAH